MAMQNFLKWVKAKNRRGPSSIAPVRTKLAMGQNRRKQMDRYGKQVKTSKGSPGRRRQSNAVPDPVTTYSRGTSNVPTSAVKTPAIRPAVDPMRPRFIGHSGTGTPTGGLPAVKPTKRPVLKKIQPVIRPVVDPKIQPMSMPQYNKGGSVARSRTGHTDYRKNGMFKK